MMKKRNGFALATIVLALTLLAILVPTLIKLMQKDSKDAQGNAKKTTAFQLAEAGQDRGAWKLRESDTIWSQAIAGTAISGYNNDVTYTDVDGGQYKILFTAGPLSGQVTVTSKGLTTNTTDVRAIRGIYSKGTVAGALSVVGGLNWKPNLNVEWGPVVAYNSITSTPANRYPRKYSAGGISGYDTDPTSPNGAMPGDNWSTYDYASYYNLGTAPTIDLNSYRALALNSCVPPLRKGSGSGAAEHALGPNGCDSGYYRTNPSSGAVNVKIDVASGGGNYTLTCATCVIFTEGAVTSFPNNSWLNVRALVAVGDVDFNAKNTTFVATVPATAQNEYQYSTAGTTYWTSKGWTNGGTYSIANCGMHGFLYTGGDLQNAGGNSIIVGALFVNGSLTVNTTTVYYDSAVGNNILYQSATISRASWDEIRTTW